MYEVPAKCINCDHCEPEGIGWSCTPECMLYKEKCDVASGYCDVNNKRGDK
jgi:hypothetical protein